MEKTLKYPLILEKLQSPLLFWLLQSSNHAKRDIYPHPPSIFFCLSNTSLGCHIFEPLPSPTHSPLPFCWVATKLRITSMANWWAFLFWSFASASTASYVSLSAKSFRLNRDGDITGPSHLSTNSWSFSNPWQEEQQLEFRSIKTITVGFNTLVVSINRFLLIF